MIILKKGKKTWEMYPIGTPKGALNNKRKPLFTAKLKFNTIQGKPKIVKYIVDEDNEEKLTPPSEAIKLFRKEAVFLTTKDEEVEQFFKSLNIQIRYTRICDHCTNQGYITILNTKSSHKYHNQTICKSCAEEIIKHELKLRGFDLKVFPRFKKLFAETKSLKTTLKVMSPKFDPVKNSNLTLYDKITVKPTNTPKLKLDELPLPKKFIKVLKKSKNTTLLPVQYLSVKNNLLKGESQLVISATASGKTLVGELAGIPRALKGKKFLYLTPLVALANQKYNDFTDKYSQLSLKISIKVGMNRIKAKEEMKIPKSNIEESDIIVGTYEGIDYILRAGRIGQLKGLGTVVIDEIHMLEDEERGPRLNGLIKRLKALFPEIQIIALSATIKNPKHLANEFDLTLVEYDQRPVPLERYLTYVRSEEEKKSLMGRLIKKEHEYKSKKGYHGQTIIFTNSRRKTHTLSQYLTRRRIPASPFHAGLSYNQKDRIEKQFAKGEISTIVTTAALAAGVDFPASQVIFESLIMGNKWISPNEFSQMLGRAGRPSFHDRGIVYLLPELSNEFDGETEESMAIELLNSDVTNVDIQYSEDDTLEQILSDISSGALTKLSDLMRFYQRVNIPIDASRVVDILYEYKLIRYDEIKSVIIKSSKIGELYDAYLRPTKYGRSVAMSFLNVEDGELIRKGLGCINYVDSFFEKGNFNLSYIRSNIERSPVLSIVLELELFESAYLAPRLHQQLVRASKSNFSTRLFADSTLDTISSGDYIARLDTKFRDILIRLQTDFLRCDCKERPFCTCLQEGVSKFIIKQRLMGKDPVEISNRLLRRYQIQAYPGDIFTWLDMVVRMIDSIKRIASSFKLNKKTELLIKECEYLIKVIEKGKVKN